MQCVTPPEPLPAAHALLDPLETDPEHPDALFEHWDGTHAGAIERGRHACWQTNRRKVYRALRATGQSSSRLDAFCKCGRNSWLACSATDPTAFRILTDKCHDRFCVPCQNEISRRVSGVVYDFIKAKRVRFITLTVRHHNEPLPEVLTKLTDAFGKLRARKAWTSRVTGGAAFLEVTYHERNGWHPHLHIIAEGKFFPHHLLQKEWQEVTVDSKIVHIAAVKDPYKAAEYVAKYATKGWSATVFASDRAVEEAMQALKGRKLLKTFGTWRGFRLRDNEDEQVWLPLCPLGEMFKRAIDGDLYALALIRHLQNPNANPAPGPYVPPAKPPDQSEKQRSPPHQHTLSELCDMTHEMSVTDTPVWRKYW